MKKNRKLAGFLAGILIIGVCCGMYYQPFMNYLSSQAAKPTGFVGNVITKIWSNYFRDLSKWRFKRTAYNSRCWFWRRRKHYIY
ncbi:hypothetical protein NV379_07695 [Paenibacillus sp. N1-5-1-14]|uniref:hypothetical protein n=1 Tax=Paenibacillus radicibacter TaxID=2972488 RepID=UPI00215952D1|nr:hypothetical protein [Paenibacillus radicibacter]MCR8642545.1 hypothetical protein [Paenibacillus radicibacter]